MNIAVVGCTGVVGTKVLQVLSRLDFDFENLYLFASKKSAGKTVFFKGRALVVEELNLKNLQNKKINIAFFVAGSQVATAYAHHFLRGGAVVIDNSSYFRLQNKVPLVVPEVNPEDLFLHNGIIANPNCSTIMLMPVLSMLDKVYGVKRVVVSTYQAVSGTGAKGIEALTSGQLGFTNNDFPIRLYSNAVPVIGTINKNGYTEEENKIILESKKILHRPDLKITATAVRVPCFNCHSQSVNVELCKKYEFNRLIAQLSTINGVQLKQQNLTENSIPNVPTTLDADGGFDIFLGRVRSDNSNKKALNFWLVFDNLLKGAALNAVQIAKLVVKNNLY